MERWQDSCGDGKADADKPNTAIAANAKKVFMEAGAEKRITAAQEKKSKNLFAFSAGTSILSESCLSRMFLRTSSSLKRKKIP